MPWYDLKHISPRPSVKCQFWSVSFKVPVWVLKCRFGPVKCRVRGVAFKSVLEHRPYRLFLSQISWPNWCISPIKTQQRDKSSFLIRFLTNTQKSKNKKHNIISVEPPQKTRRVSQEDTFVLMGQPPPPQPFWVHLAPPCFQFWRILGCSIETPGKNRGAQREHKDASSQGAAKGGRQKEFDHFFFFFFGTLSVTFWSLFLMLLSLFHHFFAKLLLPDSFCGRVIIWCGITCQFDEASDSKSFWRTTDVDVVGLPLYDGQGLAWHKSPCITFMCMWTLLTHWKMWERDAMVTSRPGGHHWKTFTFRTIISVTVVLACAEGAKLYNCDWLFKLSAYKMGVSMRLFKLQILSLFKLPLSISG